MLQLVAKEIQLSDEGVLVYTDNFPPKKVNWDEILKVIVETNDLGPFQEDIFFILITDTDEIKIGQSLNKCEELFKILQGFPNFNNEELIKSMSSMGNAQFICWQK